MLLEIKIGLFYLPSHSGFHLSSLQNDRPRVLNLQDLFEFAEFWNRSHERKSVSVGEMGIPDSCSQEEQEGSLQED